MTTLLETPLTALHRTLGANMAAFAGYDMPIHYGPGILKEHLHTRSHAGLFDVSHMGQAILSGAGATDLLESLTPGDFQTLPPGRMRYTLLLNEGGGIIDDLMVLKEDTDRYVLIVNASRKTEDFTLLRNSLPGSTSLSILHDRALLALQGPLAEAMLTRIHLAVADLPFMAGRNLLWEGQELLLTRSGYTGEDGFEISLPAVGAPHLAEALTEDETVQWIGLGARDSLRLEAGLCLYGHELNETVSPIEADLAWTISKRRRTEADFPGAPRILAEWDNGPARRRVGIRPLGRAPAREGTTISVAEAAGEIGVITSGGYSPTLSAPIAMGFVPPVHATPGTALTLHVRGQLLPATVAALPFVPHKYRK